MQAALFEQKLLQRRASQLLLRATAAVVVLAFVADRAGVGIDANADQILAGLMRQVDIGDDAQDIANFVGQFLQQYFCVGHADQSAVVAPANLQHPALGVRKTSDPFQELVAPGLLPFGVLGFRHGQRAGSGSKQANISRVFVGIVDSIIVAVNSIHCHK